MTAAGPPRPPPPGYFGPGYLGCPDRAPPPPVVVVVVVVVVVPGCVVAVLLARWRWFVASKLEAEDSAAGQPGVSGGQRGSELRCPAA